MAARRNDKRGVWLGILAVGIFLPAMLFKFSAGWLRTLIIICGCNHLARMCGFSTYKCYYLLFVSMYMTMLLLSMSTIFCLIFICTAARIIEGPANHTVPIGATVTFPCVAQGEDAFLEINTTAINYPEDINPFIEKGFSLSEEHTDTIYNYTMTVNARPENNNTMITCVVYPYDHHSGNLTVMGKLHH